VVWFSTARTPLFVFGVITFGAVLALLLMSMPRLRWWERGRRPELAGAGGAGAGGGGGGRGGGGGGGGGGGPGGRLWRLARAVVARTRRRRGVGLPLRRPGLRLGLRRLGPRLRLPARPILSARRFSRWQHRSQLPRLPSRSRLPCLSRRHLSRRCLPCRGLRRRRRSTTATGGSSARWSKVRRLWSSRRPCRSPPFLTPGRGRTSGRGPR
jgi:hypothetical protein